MTDKEMIKRTKTDLENFNIRIEMLRQCEMELIGFKKRKDPPRKEIRLLENKIRKIKLNIESIKISLQILTTKELTIITDYYFENISIRDIAIKFNLVIESIYAIKNKTLERLAKCMYGHMKDFPFLLELRSIPGECIKKRRITKPVYQYDIENNFIKKWDSAKQCGENGFCYESVRRCCIGEYKRHKGYKWSYQLLQVN